MSAEGDFFMRSPMQRKNAAKAAHGARGEQGENPPARWYSPMQKENAAKAARKRGNYGRRIGKNL
jgi:hypothetical protein